jgi:sugar phosphate isomerase/epimerase
MAWIQTGATIIFKPYSLEQALEGVAEAGFENVEIGAVSRASSSTSIPTTSARTRSGGRRRCSIATDFAASV